MLRWIRQTLTVTILGVRTIPQRLGPSVVAVVGIAGVVAATPVCPSIDVVRDWVAKLKSGIDHSERGAIVGLLREAVPDFRSEAR